MTGVLQNPILLMISWLALTPGEAFSKSVEELKHVAFPEKDLDDHALMDRLKFDDKEAFTRLFEKWKRPLISYFYRATNDYHRSEDLALEVAVKVYRARHQYTPRSKFSTWLFQIATNLLRDSWRRQKHHFRSTAESTHPDWDYPETPDPIDSRHLQIWEDWLNHALQELGANERTALLLVAQQGFTPGEAARTMQITPNHLRVLLHKARRRLKEIRDSES